MKPQDIIFLLVFIFLIFRSPKIPAILGIVCLLLSIPLFSLWVFFTAERLTWYAGAFFLLSIVLNLIALRVQKKDL